MPRQLSSYELYELSNRLRLQWQSERTVSLKIVNSCHDQEAYHERIIEDHIARQNPTHRGRVILRTCLESFEVASTEGNHLCLVYEPMREPLWILQRRFVDGRLPLPIAKAYIFFLLVGLDFLHTDCGVVHTGKYQVFSIPVISTTNLVTSPQI